MFKRNAPKFFVVSTVFMLCIGSTAISQTVRAKVSLQAERLQPQDQQILSEIPRALEDYVNNYDWTGENKDILLNCRINFVIETVTSRGSEKIFRTQTLVNSPAGENFLDKACEFPYQTGQSMEHQRTLFDPLLSMVDFYVNMVIAGEMDTYIIHGGSQYYERARNIANEGLVSNYSLGWRDRMDEVKLITDGDHKFLREAKFYYYEGLFYIEERQNTQKAPEYSAKVVELLDKIHQRRPSSPALKRFFDAHYQEFCDLFMFDSNRDNINAMMRIDNRHSETYEACQTETRRF